MKKLIFTLAIATASFAANAQTAQGNWLIGGGAGFSSGKFSGGSSVSTFFLAPNAGYFVADDIAVGAELSFASQTGGFSSFAAAPFVRYYFLPLGDAAKLLAHGSFGFGSTKDGEGEESVSATNWKLAAGPAFFLNQNVALETLVYYSSNKVKDVPSYNTFGLSVGFQIHLGGGTSKKK
ncbi:MAG TPA: outer membrane beta-barrel protein [Ferruginibacter sp.]|nr:outer membrane beta-barrel protein [Ferruginibacter sp.]